MEKNIDILRRYYVLCARPSRMRTTEQRQEIAFLEVRIKKMTAEEKRVARMALAGKK